MENGLRLSWRNGRSLLCFGLPGRGCSYINIELALILLIIQLNYIPSFTTTLTSKFLQTSSPITMKASIISTAVLATAASAAPALVKRQSSDIDG